MYQPVSIFIGLRYIKGNTTDKFSLFVSYLSTIGIIIGVMSLIIILSIMNGFEEELKKSILKFIPQALVSSKEGSLNPKIMKILIKEKGISNITPLTTSDVILQSVYNVSIGTILGIDPDQTDPLTPYLNFKQNNLKPGKYNVVLGKQLAEQLGVHIGEKLRVIVPSVSYFTLTGKSLSQHLFNIIGVFSTNSEVDSYQILVNIQDASRLMRYPLGNITGWRLWLDEPLKVNELHYQTLTNYNYEKWQDWREKRGELFQAVKMEKKTMGLLLSLIIIISSFNIVTSLGLTILKKKKDIAILQTQGMTSRQIMLIFMVQGVSSGIIGLSVGITLGVVFVSQINKFTPIIHFLFENLIIPVTIQPSEIIKIIILTITTSLLATLYPASYASSIQPAKSLRYE